MLNEHALLTHFFDPSLVEATIHQHVGPPLARHSRWATTLSVSPAYRYGILEFWEGTCSGLHLWRTHPQRVDWAAIESTYGTNTPGMPCMDAWGGPVPYRFAVAPTRTRCRGSITLWVTPWVRDEQGWVTGRPTRPRVERVSARRFTTRWS